MKKIFSLLLVVVFCLVGFTSCVEKTDVPTKVSNTSKTFEVIEIDGCEYLYRQVGYQGFLAHKGNCKYCEQRRKQEQEQDKLAERIRELLKSEEQNVVKPIESRVLEY